MKHEISSRIEAIRAAGYPVTCLELDKWYLIPDNAENAAYFVLDAISDYNSPQNEELLPVLGKAKLPGRTESMPQDMKKAISQYINDNKKSLELLYKTADLSYSRYPIDLSLGIHTILPHLSDVRLCTSLLELEAAHSSESDNAIDTANSIESILRIAGSLSQEPVIVSQSARLACQECAVFALEYAMNRIKFSDEQLTRLHRVFNKSEDSTGIQRALAGERCGMLSVYENPLIYPRDFAGDNLPAGPILKVYKVLGIMDKEEVMYLDYEKEYMDICELPFHKQINALRVLDAKIGSLPDAYLFINSYMEFYSHTIVSNVRNIAELRTAQTALSVQRYRLKNNKLPDTLGDLIPDYIETVPLDPFDGKDLRYKKLNPGFVIYSIGENQIHDGGKENPGSDRRRNDIDADITFTIEK